MLIPGYRKSCRTCSRRQGPGRELKSSSNLYSLSELLLRWLRAYQVLTPAPNHLNSFRYHYHLEHVCFACSQTPTRQLQNHRQEYSLPAPLSYDLSAVQRQEFAARWWKHFCTLTHQKVDWLA